VMMRMNLLWIYEQSAYMLNEDVSTFEDLKYLQDLNLFTICNITIGDG